MTYFEWLVLINIGEYLGEVELVLNIDIHCDKSMRLIALSQNIFLGRNFE